MRYVELFAGVGGFRLGIERAVDATCVFANEFDKYAAQTYDKNFGGSIDQRDITTIPTDDIPDHDLLVGGFPCQAFSVAGKRNGFDDTRGTLFFEIARILADKKPEHFLLENVKGLLSHELGSTFQTILGVLADLGYRVEWQVLNSKDFGVPQTRDRVLVVGHLGACCGRQVFPIGTFGGLPEGGEREASEANASALRAKLGGPDIDQTYIASTITSTYHKGVDSFTSRQLVAERAPLKFAQRNQKKIEGDYAFTVDSVNTGGVKLADRYRRLTPTECERLQGFPDGWTAGVSDTQRYRQMGNAVTTNVIEAVIRSLYRG